MPVSTIVITVVAYAVLAILVISVALASRWSWYFKAVIILLTVGLFAGSYTAVQSMIGWPTTDALPKRFSLLWTRVVEPDKFSGAEGYIYLWVEALDDDYVPNKRPRGYQLPYSAELGDGVLDAQKRRDKGDEVMGALDDSKPAEQGQLANTPPAGQLATPAEVDPALTPPMQLAIDTPPRITFSDLPAPSAPASGNL